MGALGRDAALLHDEHRVIEAFFAVELESHPADVDPRASILGDAIFVGHLPSTIEEIIRCQSQAMASPRVLRRIVGPEPGHIGVETRAADHPGRLIDDAGMSRVGARVRHPIASFLVERPAGQEPRMSGAGQAPVGETGLDLGGGECPAVDRRHGQVGVEEVRGDVRRNPRLRCGAGPPRGAIDRNTSSSRPRGHRPRLA